MKDKNLQLMIRNRDEIVFEGPVSSISSYNAEGEFDILPQHANFISLIEKHLEFIDMEGKEHNIDLKNGIVSVSKNEVKIYLGIGA